MGIEDGAPASPRQFVLLHHLMPAQAQRESHWDLMLEEDHDLLTLQLQELPLNVSSGSGREIRVTRLPDHRRAYLDYEGQISGGRGHVKRLARGRLVVYPSDPHTLHCALISETLNAEVAFRLCSPGETICLKIVNWLWKPEAE